MPTAVKIPCHASWSGPRWTFGSNGRFSELATVTFLVLLPRAAPAGVVTAKVVRGGGGGRGAARGVRLQARGGRGRRGRGRLMVLMRGIGGGLVLLVLLGLLGRADGDPQDRLRDVARDLRGHLIEERASLILIGHERILLAVAAQVDPLAELLHRGEMLDPVCVDRAQEEPALDRAGGLLTERSLASLVGLVDQVTHLRHEVLARVDALERRGGDLAAAAEERIESRGQRDEVPVLRVRRRDVRVELVGRRVMEVVQDRLPDAAHGRALVAV